MNKLNLIKIVALICCVFTLNNKSISQPLPNIKLNDLSGNQIEIQSICDSNDLVVISFWATWCAPCLKELSAIQKLYPEWQSKYNLKFVAVSINATADKQKVINRVNESAWAYQILLDDKQVFFDAMNFDSPPCTFLLNKNGEVVWSHEGYKAGDEIELENKIKEVSKFK